MEREEDTVSVNPDVCHSKSLIPLLTQAGYISDLLMVG